MKDIKLYILLLSILFFTTKSLEPAPINNVVDALANGTAAFVDLDTYEYQYVYFSFDFVYHNTLVPTSKDVALFATNSRPEVIKDNSVTYTFSEKEWHEIEDPDSLKDWANTKIEKTEKSDSDVTNYYKFKRTNNKMKTLLFRVLLGEQRNGTLTAENLEYKEKESKSGYIFISRLLYLALFLLNIW